jgi:hypothetical protein
MELPQARDNENSAQYACDDTATPLQNTTTHLSAVEIEWDGVTPSRSWEEMTYLSSRLEHLDIALRHLTAWRPIVQAVFTQTQPGYQSPGQTPLECLRQTNCRHVQTLMSFTG